MDLLSSLLKRQEGVTPIQLDPVDWANPDL